MKNCPFCAESLQEDAVKCRYCNEFLVGAVPHLPRQVKWYQRNSTLIISFLAIGPFALPLLWSNPRFSAKSKIIITAIAVILTVVLTVMTAKALEKIMGYYKSISSEALF